MAEVQSRFKERNYKRYEYWKVQFMEVTEKDSLTSLSLEFYWFTLLMGQRSIADLDMSVARHSSKINRNILLFASHCCLLCVDTMLRQTCCWWWQDSHSISDFQGAVLNCLSIYLCTYSVTERIEYANWLVWIVCSPIICTHYWLPTQ